NRVKKGGTTNAIHEKGVSGRQAQPRERESRNAPNAVKIGIQMSLHLAAGDDARRDVGIPPKRQPEAAAVDTTGGIEVAVVRARCSPDHTGVEPVEIGRSRKLRVDHRLIE